MTLKLCQVVRIDDQLNQAWVVTRINHQVADDGNLLNTNHPGSCIANQISAIPSQICCLPPLLPKPLFSGVHTATVIGPSRNDVYSDDVGRVKVKFHWDHEQAPLCDVNWVRVVQPWAANESWCDYTPSVGQEVLVKYENGDLDCPVIIGAVYNGSNKPPYAEVSQKKVSVISTLVDHDTKKINSICFDHTPGRQKFEYNAAEDLEHQIEGDYTIETKEHATVLASGNSLRVDSGLFEHSAKQKVIYRSGSSALVIHPDGIELQADKITLNSDGEVPSLPPTVDNKDRITANSKHSREAEVLQTIRVSPKWRKNN